MENKEKSLEETFDSLKSAEHLVSPSRLNGRGETKHYLRKRRISSTLTGHARFRRGPVQPLPSGHIQCSKEESQTWAGGKDGTMGSTGIGKGRTTCGGNPYERSGSSSLFVPSPSIHPMNPPPPRDPADECGNTINRISEEKIIIRVPECSSISKIEMPYDGYSWRMYGKYPIKGLSHSRSYYECTVTKECPVKKCVEKIEDDPKMLIITYEGLHQH